jgi:N-methylhydantoinase B
MWNRLIAVVEEQATTLIRTAFSTSVREAGDLSAGLFDRQGRMMAQAVTGTPGHVNAMAESVGHFITHIGPQNIFEGDVYLTNDPWMGTGHLHDITVVTPVFRKGVHIGFFASTAHVVDIGGRGFGPDGREVYEEGLLIPISKFAERGAVNDMLIRIVRANVRTPDQTVGDLYSLAACNAAGDRRLHAMLDEFGIDDLDGLSDFILTASRRATEAAIAAVPAGTYRNTMTVDGFEAPVEMVVTLEARGDSILADFTGTSGMSSFGVNVPEVYTRAYACYALKCAIAPEVPNNAGSLAPFVISAPEGSILAARRPAPVSVRHVLGHLVPDVVLGALHAAMPGTVPAEGASALWNIQISARPVRSRQRLAARGNPDVQLGRHGGAARARRAVGHGFPLGRVDDERGGDRACRPDHRLAQGPAPNSGGAGPRAAGLGQIIEIGARDGYALVVQRHVRPRPPSRPGPRGRAAGCARARSSWPMARRSSPRGGRRSPQVQRLRLSLPGGGGYGDPAGRDQRPLRPTSRRV